MLARLSIKTAAAGATLAAVGILLAPATASAQAYSYQGTAQNYGNGAYSQPFDYNQSRYGEQSRYGSQRPYGQAYGNGYDNDYCRSDRRQRQGAGVAIGATLGAVVGSQLGARGRRTEGSVLGGLLGAAVGASVGGSSARDCGYDQSSYNYRYGQPQYDNRSYGDSARYGYDDRGYSSQGSGYQSDDRYGEQAYGYDRQGYEQPYRYQRGDRYQSGCRTVAVRSRDGYGRTVTRYQQSCPDRY